MEGSFYVTIRPALQYLRIVFLLLSFQFLSQQLYATHAAGADITYRWISGNSFEVTATMYRDCEGVAAPGNITLNYYSASCNYNLFATLRPIPGTGQEITKACSTQVSKCAGGNAPGIQKWEYRGTVTLPAQCTDWHFGFTICCRNCAITTLQYPGNNCANVPAMYVEATLNNVVAPTNSSPVFNNLPVAFLCTNQTATYNHGANDANGDSLVYSFVTPRDQSEDTYVNFRGSYSATNPMSSSPPITISPTTGTINMTPTTIQVGVMAIWIREYRNGVLIGSVIRDMEFWTSLCNNILPTISGINGDVNLDLHACVGQPVNFTVNSGDVDAGQTVTMTWNNGIPAASFTTTGNPYPSGVFSWTPTAADARAQPYSFTVTVTDNNCPANGSQTATYSIVVSNVNATVTSTNSLCSNPGTGTATVVASAGTGPYSYVWTPGGSTASTRSNLTPGTYTATVTDAFGCSATASATVSAPANVAASLLSSTPVNCNGGNNGSASITASGGTAPYTYAWTPSGGTGASATGLVAGNYIATVTDAHGCRQTVPVSITQPLTLTATQAHTNVLCNGNATATASVTPAGGTPPYTYDWLPNGASTASVSGLQAGTYTVLITDARGCTQTTSIPITQAPPLLTSASGTSATCGLSNGTLAVSASGGAGPYSYLWTPGNATTSSISNVPAGAYSVRTTDANGCFVTNAVGISNAGGPTAAVASLNPVLCNGANTGSASVQVMGGSAPFTYQWQPSGGTTAAASGLAAGSYTVTIRDVNNCVSSVGITIPQPPLLQINMASTDPACFAASNGSASVSVTGGNSPYNYSWNPGGNSTSSVSGLLAGNYTVTVTDANGCTRNSTTTLVQPAQLNAAVSSVVPVACQGGNNGSASLSTSGGTLPYTYSWSPAGGTLATATGLTAGAYSVTVTDGNNCTRLVPVSIAQPAVLNAVITSTNILCSGNTTGSASVIANGGTAPYSYQWSPSGGIASSASGLGAGSYSVQITDAHGCTTSASTSVSQPSPLNLNIQAPVNVSCFGGSNGSASVSAAGGTGPYTYQWSPSGGSASSAAGLAAGSYTVNVTDAHSCVQSALVFVNQPTQLSSAIIDSTQVSCFGNATGSAQVSAQGGVAPYTYSWSGGGGNSDLANSLAAGSYTVSIADANGCLTSTSVNITQPPLLQLNTGSVNTTCGSANGSVSVLAAGGTAGYSYNWSSPGGTGTGMSSLLAGSYTVTVTDANGCIANAIASVSNTGGPTAVANKVSNVSCAGGNNGSASVAISAGTPPFAVSWSPSGGTGTVANNLSVGNYSVTVTDANGCLTSSNVNILEPQPLGIVTTYTDVLCNGAANGTASALVSGGTAGYTYSWSPGGGNASTKSNLGPGIYTVNVLDAHGCSTNALVSIAQPAPLATSMASTPVSCNGNNNGTATISAAGGTPGYSFAWTPAVSTGPTAFNLTSGSYSVTVSDANGCQSTRSISVTQPAVLVAPTGGTAALCNGANNGSASVTPAGGTAPYSYAWSPSGGTGSNATGLSAGTYTVAVTDARGCVANSSFTVSQPPVLASSLLTLNNVSCFNAANGTSSVSASGGTAPYNYAWSPSGGSASAASGLAAGNYTVTVTDQHGCQAQTPLTILQPQQLQASISSYSNVSCNGGNNGSASVSISGGTAAYGISWLPSGGTNDIASNLSAGNYSVNITDANGCTTSAPVTISQPQLILLQVTPQPALCGTANGSVTTATTGGVLPYTYAWSPSGGTGSNATGLSGGSYTVVVTDANGCQENATAGVSNMGAPTVTTSLLSGISCNGGNDASARVRIASGSAPYSVLWNPSGATNTTVNGLGAGVHSVFITDANGCIASANITISDPPALAASATATDALCNGGATGTVSVSASGGTPTYTYAWTPGGATASTLNNRPAGLYTVVVTDNNGCSQTTSAQINQPTALNLAMSSTPALCNGDASGSANVTASGGTPGYSYAWFPSGGSTYSELNVPAGNYSVTVTDNNGCTSNRAVTVTQPAPIVPVTATLPSTCGQSNGSANVSVSGGIAPYNYSWSPSGGNASSAANLPAGAYRVTVVDANGCLNSAAAGIANIGGPTATPNLVSDVSCYNGANGSASVSVINGTAPFTYSWSPAGGSSNLASNLAAGNYDITVTDANGCVSSGNISIAQPTLLVASASSTDALCFGSSDGTAAVSVAGGTGPYSYAWTPAAPANASISNLVAGNYSVTVTDGQGCTQVATTLITQPDQLNLLMAATPALCNGASDGSASVTVTGGTSGYLFAWTPAGGSGNLANNLAAGLYTVNVTDAHGCTSGNSVSVLQPTALQVQAGAQPSLCGMANGSAAAVANGGTLPYSYLWSPAGGAASTAANLSAGPYTITVLDGNGCQQSATASIANIGGPTVNASPLSQVSCFGGDNGSASVQVIGGSAPFSYQWLPTGAITATANSLAAGNHSVTVTDANGCITVGNVQISEPDVLAVSAQSLPARCFGSSDGSAVANPLGGTAPYTYQWSSGGTNAIANNLPAGSFSVLVTDALGCSQLASATVGQPAILDLIMSSVPATCNGTATGSASVVVNGGTSGYSYAWFPPSPGGNTSQANLLAMGNYSVTVTDAHGCQSVNSVTVAEPSPVNLAPSSTPSTCGSANGGAAVVANGGTSPYTYLWSNGGTTASISGLAAGGYQVDVMDANNCLTTTSSSVSNIGGPTIAAGVLNHVSCFNGANASATVNVASGTAPFNYAWSSGNNTPTAGQLAAGSYSITVTDANGCISVDQVDITQPTLLVATASAQPANCFGLANGSTLVQVSGGTSPYLYSWSGSAGTAAAASGLAAGNYTVTVTDAQGCVQTSSAVVDQPPALNLALAASPALCYGARNGSANVLATGGSPNYLYAWSPSGGSAASAQNLGSGNYSVLVTDAHGCQKSQAIQVAQPAPVLLQTASQPSFCGYANGSASVVAGGGTAPYAYQWIPSGGNLNTATGLPAANYSVIVTDAHGCNGNASIIVLNIPGPDLATAVTSPVSCFGGSNGSGVVNVTNGTAPYQYAWLPSGGNAAQASNLSAGNYTVTVTDARGCIATDNLSVSQPLLLAALPSASDARCFGSSDGSAQVQVTGGTSPYQYQWNPTGVTTPIVGNLPAGNYQVTVTDANGCIRSAPVFVNQPQALNLQMQSSPALCHGAASGSAAVSVTGGTSGYSYAWLPAGTGGNAAAANNIAAGNYSVTVTDAHGCLETNTIAVSEPAALNAIPSMVSARCHLSSDGSASVAVQGGTAPYAYLWSPGGSTGNSAANLSAGNYSVAISDAHGCVLNSVVSVSAPAALALASIASPALCHGNSNGSATVSASGGTAPYTYAWSPSGGSLAHASQLAAGTYSVLVTDDHGCTQTSTATVTQPSPLLLNAAGSATLCIGQSTGITSGATGGTAPYSFLWNNGITTSSQNVHPVSTTAYSVTVTDANGCSTAQQAVLVTVLPPLDVIASGNSNLCAGMTSHLSAVATGGNGVYSYVWDDGSFGNTLTVTPSVTTTYTVTATDGCGTPPASDLVQLRVNPLPAVAFTPQSMQGCSPLAVQFQDASNAGPGATFLWNFGDSTSQTGSSPSHTYANPGTYTVSLQVTSAHGCRGQLTKPRMISVHPNPVASFIQSDHAVKLLENQIEFTSTGQGASTYAWDFGDGTYSSLENPIHHYDDTGTFMITLVVTTQFGCQDITYGWLKVSEGFTIYIPNAFTPNGDGANDGFIALGTGWTGYDMWILDRWGGKIYHSVSESQPWDGTHYGNGEQCQVGVYEYVIRVSDSSGRQHQFTGHVTLVK